MIYQILSILFCLFLSSNLFAKNVALTLQGAGNDTLNGVEFIDGTITTNHCLQETGWDTSVLNSKVSSDGSFKREMDKHKIKNFNPNKSNAEVFKSPPLPTPDPNKTKEENIKIFKAAQAELDKATEAYTEDVKNRYLDSIISSLKSADNGGKEAQFLLRINAHGTPCSLQDPSKGHCIQVQEPGSDLPVLLETERISQVIAENTPKGVKVAVDLKACFSGLAVKDFAKNGVCAYGYSAPDALLILCGGSDTDPSNAGDLHNSYLCRNVQKDRLDITEKTLSLYNEEDNNCFKRTQDYFKENTEFKDEKDDGTKKRSLSELQTTFRDLDRSPNQMMGTDGPFWVFDKLSDFGFTLTRGPYAGNEGNGDLFVCAREDVTFSRYTDNFIKEIDNLSRDVFKNGCSFKSEIEKVLGSTKNKKTLMDFSNKKAKLEENTYQADTKIEKLFPLEQIMRSMNVDNGGMYPSEYIEEMSKENSKIIGVARSTVAELGIIKKNSGEEGLNSALMRTYQVFFGVEDLEEDEKLKRMQELLIEAESIYSKEIEMASKDQLELEEHMINDLVPLERELYSTLKNSDTYTQCVKTDENLLKAKKDCEEFKI